MYRIDPALVLHSLLHTCSNDLFHGAPLLCGLSKVVWEKQKQEARNTQVGRAARHETEAHQNHACHQSMLGKTASASTAISPSESKRVYTAAPSHQGTRARTRLCYCCSTRPRPVVCPAKVEHVSEAGYWKQHGLRGMGLAPSCKQKTDSGIRWGRRGETSDDSSCRVHRPQVRAVECGMRDARHASRGRRPDRLG